MFKKIVVTGGTGRFGKILKSLKKKDKFLFPNKRELNILNFKNIEKYLKKIKPNIVIHLAGLSRPMNIHDQNISKSIDLNIIGTANITKACEKKNIKLIYFSTNYVYPGKKGNYKEDDPIKPWNNYSWSKLGGECATQMYKNSLIIRLCMTEKPFLHKKAYANVKTNFLFQDEAAKLIFKVINQKGILNLGGTPQTVYQFAKRYNGSIKKAFSKGELPKRIDMNLTKLKKLIK